MSHRIDFLYFDDCPSHVPARTLLNEVVGEVAPGTAIEVVNATDPEVAAAHRFPGSPTIRVDGRDVMPGFRDPGDYTPRCRLHPTQAGLRGVPPRQWIEDALRT
jgi:hypothetical protein